jgi:hypothetical protein
MIKEMDMEQQVSRAKELAEQNDWHIQYAAGQVIKALSEEELLSIAEQSGDMRATRAAARIRSGGGPSGLDESIYLLRARLEDMLLAQMR